MSLFKQLIIVENEKTSTKEKEFTVSLINKCYNEWRKIRRRINAVDIITTTANRINKINPEAIKFLDDETKMKLAIIMMRCMDNPPWKPIGGKEKLYEKLWPLIKPIENHVLNTGTGGTLKQIIMTRISASLAMQDEDNKGKIMVCYEPRMPTTYSNYLLGDHKPDAIYKMQPLSMSGDFQTLIDVLKIDLAKAKKKFDQKET